MTARSANFLRPRRAPRAGFVLLVMGLLALAGARWQTQQWADERQALLQAQEDQRAEQARQRPMRPAFPSAQERRLQQVQSALARPWLPTLRAVEAASVDPVYLLGLSIDGTSGSVKLEAEAPTFEHALSFTQVVADGQVLRTAALSSHETVNDPATGRQAVRFSVLAGWKLP